MSLGCVARRGEDTARGKSGGEGSGATRGEAQKQEVALETALSGGRRCGAPVIGETDRQAGGGRRWTNLQFQKIPGTQL